MKTMIVATLLSVTGLIAEARSFDAVVTDDKLHVALQTDGCNAYGVELEIPGECRAGRMTRNWARSCNIGLRVISTAMVCGESTPSVQLFVIDLKESGLTDEATDLTLHYANDTLALERN